MSHQPKIIYTKTDEAPYLATHSLLPMIEAITKSANIDFETKDISLAARVLSAFPDILEENQRVPDALAELGEWVQKPEANVIKLPNISASIPQLKNAISELQNQGFALPNYPDEPGNEKEKEIKTKYDSVKGSAVNPVLRQGNSDRRAPKPVKNFAQKHPYKVKPWSEDSKTAVATMHKGDFRHTEKSVTIPKAGAVEIKFSDQNGQSQLLRDPLELTKDEIIDGAIFSKKALIQFLDTQIARAKEKGVLFSVHMKATMMKVSDPIIFGHVVKRFFKDVFEKYAEDLKNCGADPNSGLGAVLSAINELPKEKAQAINKAIQEDFDKNADLAMVDSDNGITNLHVPSDVIIDASMPAMIRNAGQMWNKKGETQDTLAVIPESSYAGLYDAAVKFCQKHGAFDPATMGTVPNVGLMADKAEEYGSHDKTFEIPTSGKVEVIDVDSGDILMSHEVEEGDLWRMCQTKDAAVKNWVHLAVERAKDTGWPTVFWLDDDRAHDIELIKKVEIYLKEESTEGLDLKIMSQEAATEYSLNRVKNGENTISVTGNVLRDYLTDLFPILELGTSAKMLSIVPLLNGGGLFETGAGGSAPKHVQQFIKENHLRWDSLGEFLALSVSLNHFGKKYNNKKALILSETLDVATDQFLSNQKSPSRKVNELDNRGSHYYLVTYWADALAKQEEDEALSTQFIPVAKALKENEDKIIQELNEVQGSPVDLKGYYKPDEEIVFNEMRPSKTLNRIIKSMN